MADSETSDLIYVVLDAEALKRDPFRSRGAFRALALLSDQANVQIHVPYVAAQEFLSSQRAAVETEFSNARTALSKVRMRLALNDRAAIEETLATLSAKAEAAYARVEKLFDEWCAAHNVEIDQVNATHGKDVLDAYFAGTPPFRQPKHRDDFPDAFIVQALRDVTKDDRDVIFISGDTNLREAAANFADSVYASIEDFLKEEDIVAFLRRGILESQMELLGPAILEALFGADSVTTLLASQLLMRKVAVYFPIDGVGTIAEVLSIDRLWPGEALTYYGKGLVGIPVSARATCRVVMEAAPDAVVSSESGQTTIVRDDGMVEVSLRRTFVAIGSVLAAVAPKVLENEVKRAAVVDAVRACEVVLDQIQLEDDPTGNRPPFEELLRHAFDEAERQVAAGDLGVTVDEREEAILSERAQWSDVPERFHGKHGKITILPTARMKIKPLGRFELLVKIAKRSVLTDEADESTSDEGTGGG